MQSKWKTPKVQPKIKTIDAPVQHKQHKQHKENTISYSKTLSETTKTVAQLYDAYRNYFPVEYNLLINPLRLPTGNGNILRFSKNTINGYVMVARPKSSVDSGFTDAELDDLSNCRVFLETNQTELNYIDRWFKYVIEERGITNYRLRQMYWMSKLDDVSEDDVNDPDYIPEDESDPEDEYDEDESEAEDDNEDEDDSADYTPSVESEAEDDNDDDEEDNKNIAHSANARPELRRLRFRDDDEEDNDEDEDDSADYTPSVESEAEDSGEEEDSEDEDDSPDYTPSVESEAEEDDSADEDKSPDYTPSVESEEEESDDDYEDVVNKYKLLKQKLKEQHQKQIARKSQRTRSH